MSDHDILSRHIKPSMRIGGQLAKYCGLGWCRQGHVVSSCADSLLPYLKEKGTFSSFQRSGEVRAGPAFWLSAPTSLARMKRKVIRDFMEVVSAFRSPFS